MSAAVSLGARRQPPPPPPRPPKRSPRCRARRAAARRRDQRHASLCGGAAARIRRGEIGGVILFGGNITGPEQLLELTGALQAAARQGGQPPLLIATDQEGGAVRRLAWVGPSSSASRLGRCDRRCDPARGTARRARPASGRRQRRPRPGCGRPRTGLLPGRSEPHVRDVAGRRHQRGDLVQRWARRRPRRSRGEALPRDRGGAPEHRPVCDSHPAESLCAGPWPGALPRGGRRRRSDRDGLERLLRRPGREARRLVTGGAAAAAQAVGVHGSDDHGRARRRCRHAWPPALVGGACSPPRPESTCCS